MEADERPWLPAVDRGELKFRFCLSPGENELPDLAAQLEQPPLALYVTPSPGPWRRSGSLAALEPQSVRLLALKPAEAGSGIILRAQQLADRPARVRLTWLGRKMDLGELGPWQIGEWRVHRRNAKS